MASWTQLIQFVRTTVTGFRAVDTTALPSYNVDDVVTPNVNKNTGNLVVEVSGGGGGGGGVLNTAIVGTTPAGNVSSTTASANRQPLDVTLYDTSGNPLAVGGGTQYPSGATVPTPTGTIALGKFNSSPPTVTNGNVVELQTDSAGNLKTNNRNLTSSDTPLATTNADTTIGGTTAPTKGLLIIGKTNDGTPQYQPVPLTAGGAAVKTDASATTQPISAASLPLPTGAATNTAITSLQVAQGATSSGLNGGLDLANVTNLSPIYVTGQSNPNSLTTAGALRADGATMVAINNNVTLTTTGSATVSGVLGKELVLTINVSGAVTGTTPTLTYSIQDTCPSDLTTTVGQAITGAAITATGTQIIVALCRTGAVKVTWTITGTTPSFAATRTTLAVRLASQATPSTGVKGNVAGSATSVTLQAANSQRKGWMCFNDSTVNLYIDLTGGTASTSSYTVIVAPNQLYVLDFFYIGLITGIWASATGNARVTEFT